MTPESCPQHIQTSDAYVVVWLEFGSQLRHFRASMATSSGKRPANGAPAAKAAASANVEGKAASGSGPAAAEELISPKKPRIDIEELGGSVPRMPDLPGNHVHVSTYMLMRQVVPFVMHALPGALDGLHVEHERDLVACPPYPNHRVGKSRCASQLQGGVGHTKLRDGSRVDQHVRG
mgnify:CR=1 FL=1